MYSIQYMYIYNVCSCRQYRPITVQAVVNETLTGVQLSGAATFEYFPNKIKLEFLESTPDTFKPGLNYTAFVSSFRFYGPLRNDVGTPFVLCQARVTQQDGSPLDTADTQHSDGSDIMVSATLSYYDRILRE